MPISVTPALRGLALPAVLAATLALTSCGTGSSAKPGAVSTATPGAAAGAPTAGARPTGAGTPAKGAVRGADVGFATMMIPQQVQAGTMADLALRQATDAKVKALAAQIKKAAVSEAARMSGWFTSVGGVVPTPMTDPAGRAEMAQHGILSEKEMTALGAATGARFDRMWLQVMIRNQKGAVDLAKAEIATGGSPDVKQVAQTVIDRHPPRVAEMTTILAAVPQS
jgi:uncharacterized protein (DUF305 family)